MIVVVAAASEQATAYPSPIAAGSVVCLSPGYDVGAERRLRIRTDARWNTGDRANPPLCTLHGRIRVNRQPSGHRGKYRASSIAWFRRCPAPARKRCRAWCMTCTFGVETTNSPRPGFESGMETVDEEN